MKLKNGFSLIELMIIVAIIGILSLVGMPFYKTYITRIRLTEVIQNYSRIIRDIQVGIASNDALAHDYTADKLVSLAKPDLEQFVGLCYDDKTVAKELHWNNKDKIAKVTKVDATYVRQFVILTYESDKTGYCKGKKYMGDITKLYTVIGFSPDLTTLGISESYKPPSSGHNSAYRNEIVVLSIGGTVDYHNTLGIFEKRTENLAIACGLYTYSNNFSNVNLSSSDMPSHCRYFSFWNPTNTNRKMIPFF